MLIMTSTLLQQQITQTTNASAANMGWSNEKLRFSCIDNIGLKQLWKLIALDTPTHATRTNATTNKPKTNKTNVITDNLKQKQQQQQYGHPQQSAKQINNNNNSDEQSNFENCENLAEYLMANRDILPPSRMSLLKFLAINALELSAPASPALLEQHNQQQTQLYEQSAKPQGWVQLSGHPESIVPTSAGVVRKRITSFNDSEVHAYQLLSQESQTAKIVPQFYGTLLQNDNHFIELQDLLAGFKDPCVMDIKLGCRTFLESEVTNQTLRADLYKKMVSVDAEAPTAEEHESKAITKLRYMLFREAMSSSHAKGFRIEALRMRGRAPVKDLKTVRTNEQIAQTIEQFLGHKRTTHKELIKRLKQMRSVIEKSQFFQRHEIVGSSIFIVYDDDKVGAWLIDFAKSRQLPNELNVTHRAEWLPGNREEGLLKGMDELINAFENVYARHTGRRCLQI